MKKLVSLALIAASLAVSARALVLGADIGYLTDNQDAYFSGRIGAEFKADATLSHQIELELGHTEHSETVAPLGAPVKATSKISPLTVNYRAEATASGKLGYYFGAGLGVAKTSFDMPGSGLPTISDSATGFAILGFTGATYQATPNTKLYLGVKYLWIDDVDMFGTSVEVGDDLAITIGVGVKF